MDLLMEPLTKEVLDVIRDLPSMSWQKLGHHLMRTLPDRCCPIAKSMHNENASFSSCCNSHISAVSDAQPGMQLFIVAVMKPAQDAGCIARAEGSGTTRQYVLLRLAWGAEG